MVVLVVATPVVFLVAELAAEPSRATIDAFLRPRTLRLTVNTIALTAAVTSATVAIGILTAYVLIRTVLAGRRFWLIVSALPLAIPSYVAGFAWITIAPFRGFIGSFLVLVLVSTPYVTLPVAAALRRADVEVEHVARTLGAGRLRAFAQTTLPQIAPAAGAGGLLVALYTLSDFGVVAIMRFPAFTWAIQTAFSGSFNRSLAMVLALVLVVLALSVVAIERALRVRNSVAERVGQDDAGERVRLGGAGQAAAFLVLAAWFLAAAGVPLGTLVLRSINSVAAHEWEVERMASAALVTVVLGLAGAAVATAMALPIGILAARSRSRTVRTLESATYMGHALPGIVMGLAMVYLALAFVPALYQTAWLLVVAYGILFTPKAMGSIRSAVAQVPPELEDVSRSLGRGYVRTLTDVTARIAWPGIATGALLVALTVMKELPATLMLRPTGTDTLATRLWQLTDISAYGAAAPYGIILVAVATIPAYLLARQSGAQSHSRRTTR